MQDSLFKKYAEKFPNLKDLLERFNEPFKNKLWNELTNLILEFLYNKDTKNRVDFDFYEKFVKNFQESLDNIKLLKIVRMCIHNLEGEKQLAFLKEFEKTARLSDQAKLIVQAMQGLALVDLDISKCLPIIESLKKQIEGKKDIEQYLYSTYYKLDFSYYRKKGKFRQFYTNALQYLAYTNYEELNEKEQIELSYEMGVAVLLSKDIYNFSELLQQPLLKSLNQGAYAWVYKLLEIFNKGDIKEYNAFKASPLAADKVFQENVKSIDEKIQVASFLEIVFNQPKNDRVLTFERIASVAGVAEDRAEWIVMRAMGLGLVKGGIDQLKKIVTTVWSKPKVLELARIKVMEAKFEQWNIGLKSLSQLLSKRDAGEEED